VKRLIVINKYKVSNFCYWFWRICEFWWLYVWL